MASSLFPKPSSTSFMSHRLRAAWQSLSSSSTVRKSNWPYTFSNRSPSHRPRATWQSVPSSSATATQPQSRSLPFSPPSTTDPWCILSAAQSFLRDIWKEKWRVLSLSGCLSALRKHDFHRELGSADQSTWSADDKHCEITIRPYAIHHSNSPSIILVTSLLTGDNYGSWSRAVTMALWEKCKLKYVDGSLPVLKDKVFVPNLERCNDLVGSWILNSLSPEIHPSILYANTASQIWTDLKEYFSQSNVPKIYQLKQSIDSLKKKGCLSPSISPNSSPYGMSSPQL